MKNVAIYYPNGTTSYFEVGAKLLDQDKKETEVEVSSIVEKNNKIIVKFSDKSQIAYANLPFSTIKNKYGRRNKRRKKNKGS